MLYETQSMDQIMIFLCGVFCLGFAIFHTQFRRLFNWKEDLDKIKPVNKAIIQIANLCLIYFFLLAAALCFIFPEELSTTGIGHFFLGGMSVFWLARTIQQFIFIRIDHPVVHLLTYLFLVGAILFAIPVLL